MKTLVLTEWLVEDNIKVKVGDAIATLETSKVSIEEI